MNPRDLNVSDYTYVLPNNRIAQFPLTERDQAGLLIYDKGQISEDIFSELATHLPDDTTLVFNDTKVIHARLLFTNNNGATIEVFLLEPILPYRELQQAMFVHGACTWRCFVGNARKWREPLLSLKIMWQDSEGTIEASLLEQREDDYLVHFAWSPAETSFAKVLLAAGDVPLPPYIKRNAGMDDESRYQTEYAVQDGSVAAPTAGLHFTGQVFQSLREKNICLLFTTLHVSAGTFLPVKNPLLGMHHMHTEQMVIRNDLPQQLMKDLKAKKKIVAVGTTSLRTIESLYWLGKKIISGEDPFNLDQWYAYQAPAKGMEQPAPCDALLALHQYMESNRRHQLIAETQLLIAPGYQFRIADGLITNFHQPGSTLLLLVAALIGNDWKRVYDYALENNFRFLSYGDASLLWKNPDAIS